MTNLDILSDSNIDDDAILLFRYTTEHDVSLREYPEERNVIVNKTDSLEIWWKLMSLECNRDNFLIYLDRGREFLEGDYYIPVSNEQLLFDEPEIYKAYKENSDDLFEILECETINHDSKSGLVKGTWETDFYWKDVKNDIKFFEIIKQAEGQIDLEWQTAEDPFKKSLTA